MRDPASARRMAASARTRFARLGHDAWRARAEALVVAADVGLDRQAPALVSHAALLADEMRAQGLGSEAMSSEPEPRPRPDPARRRSNDARVGAGRDPGRADRHQLAVRLLATRRPRRARRAHADGAPQRWDTSAPGWTTCTPGRARSGRWTCRPTWSATASGWRCAGCRWRCSRGRTRCCSSGRSGRGCWRRGSSRCGRPRTRRRRPTWPSCGPSRRPSGRPSCGGGSGSGRGSTGVPARWRTRSTLAELQAGLGEDTALVAYVVTADRVVAPGGHVGRDRPPRPGRTVAARRRAGRDAARPRHGRVRAAGLAGRVGARHAGAPARRRGSVARRSAARRTSVDDGGWC